MRRTLDGNESTNVCECDPYLQSDNYGFASKPIPKSCLGPQPTNARQRPLPPTQVGDAGAGYGIAQADRRRVRRRRGGMLPNDTHRCDYPHYTRTPTLRTLLIQV